MARKSPNFRTEEKEYKIYVLLFPPSNDFYIGNSGQKELYTTLKNHCQLLIDRTKERIKTYIEEEKKAPQMYLIDTTKEVKTDNFKRLIAYAKVMEDNGYHCINNGLFREDMEDMLPATQAIYEHIKDTVVNELLDKSKELYSNYTPGRKQSKEKTRMSVSLSISPEDYTIIEQRARKAGLPISRYVYEACMYGVVVDMDNAVMREYLNEIRHYTNLLDKLILAVCCDSNILPPHLEQIQNAKDTILEQYSNLLKINIKNYNKLEDFYKKMKKANS